MPDQFAVIISRNRDSGSQHQEVEQQIVAALAGHPELTVTVLPHLYDLEPDGPAFETLRSISNDMIVLGWIYPRAMYWVLDANGISGQMGETTLLPEGETADPSPEPGQEKRSDRMIWCLDLRARAEAKPYLEEIGRITGVELAVPAEISDKEVPGQGGSATAVEAATPRWYPVIDFSRCTNCLECLNFCLFGVFGLDDEESLLLEQPDACRDGCPACSRICPAGAIMFPQHNDPAIAGDESSSSEGLKLDLSQLFAGADPAQLTATQRDRALAEQRCCAAKKKESPTDKPADPNDLDRLVDEVDDLDL